MMYSYLAIKMILFAVVSGQDWGLLQFSRDHSSLVECIESHIFLKDHAGVFDVREYIIAYVAEEYHSRTRAKETVGQVRRYIDKFLHKTSNARNDSASSLWKEFEENLQKALLDCSDNGNLGSGWGNNTDPDGQEIHQLPVFIDEPAPGVNILLDHLLVNNLMDRRMFNTPDRRTVFRSFAEDSIRILRHFSTETIRNLENHLESEWQRRAELFYDGEAQIKYINHLYTSHYHLPYASNDPAIFINRSRVDFAARDPPAFQHEIQSVVRNRPRNPFFRGNRGNDSFDRYESEGMSGHIYYFQALRFQFFRLLLVYVELVRQGYLRPEVEDYKVPHAVKKIAFNNVAYCCHLDRLVVEEFTVSDDDNDYWQILVENPRISELNLIMLMLIKLNFVDVFIGTITNTTSTSTTSSTSSTTPSLPSRTKDEYAKKPKEDSSKDHKKYSNNKCYDTYDSHYNEPSPSTSKKCSDKRRHSNLLNTFCTDETIFTMKIIHIYLEALGKSQINNEMLRYFYQIV